MAAETLQSLTLGLNGGRRGNSNTRLAVGQLGRATGAFAGRIGLGLASRRLNGSINPDPLTDDLSVRPPLDYWPHAGEPDPLDRVRTGDAAYDRLVNQTRSRGTQRPAPQTGRGLPSSIHRRGRTIAGPRTAPGSGRTVPADMQTAPNEATRLAAAASTPGGATSSSASSSNTSSSNTSSSNASSRSATSRGATSGNASSGGAKMHRTGSDDADLDRLRASMKAKRGSASSSQPSTRATGSARPSTTLKSARSAVAANDRLSGTRAGGFLDRARPSQRRPRRAAQPQASTGNDSSSDDGPGPGPSASAPTSASARTSAPTSAQTPSLPSARRPGSPSTRSAIAVAGGNALRRALDKGLTRADTGDTKSLDRPQTSAAGELSVRSVPDLPPAAFRLQSQGDTNPADPAHTGRASAGAAGGPATKGTTDSPAGAKPDAIDSPTNPKASGQHRSPIGPARHLDQIGSEATTTAAPIPMGASSSIESSIVASRMPMVAPPTSLMPTSARTADVQDYRSSTDNRQGRGTESKPEHNAIRRPAKAPSHRDAVLRALRSARPTSSVSTSRADRPVGGSPSGAKPLAGSMSVPELPDSIANRTPIANRPTPKPTTSRKAVDVALDAAPNSASTTATGATAADTAAAGKASHAAGESDADAQVATSEAAIGSFPGRTASLPLAITSAVRANPRPVNVPATPKPPSAGFVGHSRHNHASGHGGEDHHHEDHHHEDHHHEDHQPGQKAGTASAAATADDRSGSGDIGSRFLAELRREHADRPRKLPGRFDALARSITGSAPVGFVTGSATQRALATVGKKAATIGNNIFLAGAPGRSARDDEIIGHELTHVARPSPLPRFFDDGRHSTEERLATSVGRQIGSAARRGVAPSIALLARAAGTPNLRSGPLPRTSIADATSSAATANPTQAAASSAASPVATAPVTASPVTAAPVAGRPVALPPVTLPPVARPPVTVSAIAGAPAETVPNRSMATSSTGRSARAIPVRPGASPLSVRATALGTTRVSRWTNEPGSASIAGLHRQMGTTGLPVASPAGRGPATPASAQPPPTTQPNSASSTANVARSAVASASTSTRSASTTAGAAEPNQGSSGTATTGAPVSSPPTTISRSLADDGQTLRAAADPAAEQTKAAAAPFEDLDDLIEKIEERVLYELERRGARFRGGF